jgi:hypothetical protein
MATTRTQARQVITHGHVLMAKIFTFIFSFVEDVVTLSERTTLTTFLADVIGKE